MPSMKSSIDWSDVWIKTSRLRQYADPTRSVPWVVRNYHPITLSCVKSAPLNPESYPSFDPTGGGWTRRDHLGRIKWLMQNPWESDIIEVDVGPNRHRYKSYWIIGDGNHRLSALILMRKRWVHCSCGGNVDLLEYMFDGAVNLITSKHLTES